MRRTCPGAGRDAAASGPGEPPLWGGDGDSASFKRVQLRGYSYDFCERCPCPPPPGCPAGGQTSAGRLRNAPFQSSNGPPVCAESCSLCGSQLGRDARSQPVSELKTTEAKLRAHSAPGPSGAWLGRHRPGCSSAAPRPGLLNLRCQR